MKWTPLLIDWVRYLSFGHSGIPPWQASTNVFSLPQVQQAFLRRAGHRIAEFQTGLTELAFAIYFMMAVMKGTSCSKLHPEIGVTQKAAGLFAHHIRETLQHGNHLLLHRVGVHKEYIGGLESNKHRHKKHISGRGPVDKTAVVGIRNRHWARKWNVPIGHYLLIPPVCRCEPHLSPSPSQYK